jgi:large subunit ribosomal protein L24e
MKCTFCESEIPAGTGKMYVKKDGKVFWFCSSKCEKNMIVLGRKARNIKWTGESRAKKQSLTKSE